MVRFVTIEKFCSESGYSPDAVRSKIKRGDWLEGAVWIKAPDGRVLIDVVGFEAWASTGDSWTPPAGPLRTEAARATIPLEQQSLDADQVGALLGQDRRHVLERLAVLPGFPRPCTPPGARKRWIARDVLEWREQNTARSHSRRRSKNR